MEGEVLGKSVGALEGNTLGRREGLPDGSSEGDCDGEVEGASVASNVKASAVKSITGVCMVVILVANGSQMT